MLRTVVIKKNKFRKLHFLEYKGFKGATGDFRAATGVAAAPQRGANPICDGGPIGLKRTNALLLGVFAGKLVSLFSCLCSLSLLEP